MKVILCQRRVHLLNCVDFSWENCSNYFQTRKSTCESQTHNVNFAMINNISVVVGLLFMFKKVATMWRILLSYSFSMTFLLRILPSWFLSPHLFIDFVMNNCQLNLLPLIFLLRGPLWLLTFCGCIACAHCGTKWYN